MLTERIILVCELLCMLVLLRLCIVLLGKRRHYRNWLQQKERERYEESYH